VKEIYTYVVKPKEGEEAIEDRHGKKGMSIPRYRLGHGRKIIPDNRWISRSKTSKPEQKYSSKTKKVTKQKYGSKKSRKEESSSDEDSDDYSDPGARVFSKEQAEGMQKNYHSIIDRLERFGTILDAQGKRQLEMNIKFTELNLSMRKAKLDSDTVSKVKESFKERKGESTAENLEMAELVMKEAEEKKKQELEEKKKQELEEKKKLQDELVHTLNANQIKETLQQFTNDNEGVTDAERASLKKFLDQHKKGITNNQIKKFQDNIIKARPPPND